MVYAFAYKDGFRPDCDDLVFDLTKNYSSPWNNRIIKMLLREMLQRCEEENWLVKKPDCYLRDALKNQYKKLCTTWLTTQPKLIKDGVLETPEEVEAQLINRMQQLGRASRQATHCHNVGYSWMHLSFELTSIFRNITITLRPSTTS